MTKTLGTDAVIEQMVLASCGADASEREKHVTREALRGLVRLAKSEQMLEMKANIDKLAGTIAARAARRQTRTLLLAHRLSAITPGQKQLEFTQKA